MEQKILLVDDEEGIRTVLGISLADMGYEVLKAENGERALALFEAESPPIVITDIKMPGISGVDLLAKIKKRSPDTEVIMISGHGDMELAIESLKNDAVDFITKPINDDALEIALKRAEEKISMRNQIREHTENLEALVKEKSEKLVEAERLAAVGQAVEGLSSAIWGIAGDIDSEIKCFNEMPCFVSVHNRDLRVVTANRHYTEQLGKGPGDRSCGVYETGEANHTGNTMETGGATCEAEGPRDCPAAVTFREERGQRLKRSVNYNSGGPIPVVVYTAPIRNNNGEIELVLEISADIAEVKRLQEELSATRKSYQQLFDEVPCYITVTDRDLNLTAVNRRFKEDFGGALGHKCYSVYKRRGEPCRDCPTLKTFADGKSHHEEKVVTAGNGEQYHLLVSTAPIRNSAGEVTQVMEMSANITEIRQLQDQLVSLGLLIGSISHGIKGLLTGLDGGMYILGSGFKKGNTAQLEEGWETVKLMVERIRTMILDILYYAKERELEWESVDLLCFAADIARTAELKIKDRPIEFVRDFDDTLGKFKVDPSVTRSALINILDNALDACVADTSKTSHSITFSVRQEGGDTLFEVADDGIGMDPETRDSIFTLFYSSKGKKGTGLGLFISHKIIRQHGGDIEVSSEKGEGTRFRIRIPGVPAS